MKYLVTAGLVLALSGCANLEAVRDISDGLSNASGSWNDVGSEIFASCEREATINPALIDCEQERKASAGLAAANAVLGNYFGTLMNAANGSNFTVQPGIDNATAAVAGIPGVNTEQVQAVSGLIGLIAKFATEAARESALRQLIEQGGPAAQTVVRGMDDLVVPRLTRRLETEQLQLTGQFGRLINAQRDNAGADPTTLCAGSAASRFSGTGYLLTLEYCRRLTILDQRTKALADYRSSLAIADKALTELQSSRTKLKAGDLARKLYAIGAQLNDRVRAVRKSFG